MASIPAFIRHRFRTISPGALGSKQANGPGVAVLIEGDGGDEGQPLRILEVVAAGSDIYAVAADLEAGHRKGNPDANVHAEAALIPDLADRERAVRELAALCAGGAYGRREGLRQNGTH